VDNNADIKGLKIDHLVIQPVLMLLYNLLQTNCFWAYVCMEARGLW